ncbi:N-acetyllactosaminide beta-1,3-N-acetylglucosaminyltransferase 3-like [Nelusetta ayraudi]|uniref:N-acetyllactosaminide beta-1,3-N-acetylglucosaminyltransferase 3-like n=1 Tax=Nelusetta ayraudi TaxID=303726 RepID=UPI003F6F15C0
MLLICRGSLRSVSMMKFFTKITFSLLVGTWLLLAYLQYNGNRGDDKLCMKNADPNQTMTVSNNARQVCQQRKSVANMTNFDSFPENLKRFLYYQHCRHFPLLLDSPGKCRGDDSIFLLMVIKSSPGNYERREVLRKTWANERKVDGVQIRRMFISGTTADGFEKIRLNKLLKLEQQEYNDIVQWDFEDTHYNLTLKQALLMEWLHKNCPDVSFLLNGDDDIFAHTENMVEYLKSLEDDDGSRHLFSGFLHHSSKPIRDMANKYFVPPEVYMSDNYPPFLSGGGILLSKYTATVMYNMSKHIPLFPLDDVYLGILLAKAQLNLTSHAGVKTFGLDIPFKNVDVLDPCFYKDLLLAHRFLPTQLYIMWHGVHDPDLQCFS